MNSRLFIIGMCALLMLGAVYIIGTALQEEGTRGMSTTLASDPISSIPIERGVFSRSGQAISYQQMPGSQRSLDGYYENRAYPGAPPTIPHRLISEKGIGGETCLQCHQNGGYSEQFSAFAPVTPHPELLNCKQCHVPKTLETAFKTSNWKKIATPNIHQAAMPGAPPVIPHTLEMRNNCLSCHAGPAAPKEIRVTHPERVNCRQCHVPKLLSNPDKENPIFQRGNQSIGYSEKPLKETEIRQISEWINRNVNN